jgi:probable F420-dependent oxidoreductase
MYANGARSAERSHALALPSVAESAGYESLWAVQHVVVPLGPRSRYPYSDSGDLPGGEFVPVPDPLIWLAFAAGVTTRIRLATGVLILPQQHPLVVAKQAATLDRLSGGRVLLGVGAGWLREEFDALGATFEARGRRLDEAIGVMRNAWGNRVATSDGPAYPHGPVAVEPKPARGTVPIVIGGNSDAALRRAGRLGDGYFPMGAHGDDLGRLVLAVRRHADEAGRDPSSIEITATAPRDEAEAETLQALGVARIVVSAPGVDEGLLPERLAARMDAVRQLMPVAA